MQPNPNSLSEQHAIICHVQWLLNWLARYGHRLTATERAHMQRAWDHCDLARSTASERVKKFDKDAGPAVVVEFDILQPAENPDG